MSAFVTRRESPIESATIQLEDGVLIVATVPDALRRYMRISAGQPGSMGIQSYGVRLEDMRDWCRYVLEMLG